MIETWTKTDNLGRVIESGRAEKATDSVTLKKDGKGNITWEIKAYGMSIEEAAKKALETKEKIEAALLSQTLSPYAHMADGQKSEVE